MIEFDIDAGMVKRKKNFVLYVKEGSQLVDLLNVMEAHGALMELENVRIIREISGTVNRKVNCETANINKTVSAAVQQINDIILLRDKVGFDNLPEGLAEIAEVRLAKPEASLKELGDSLDPPVGKSGVNHRLRKIKEIANGLREDEEEKQ
jgi:DNA-binding protein WhiA